MSRPRIRPQLDALALRIAGEALTSGDMAFENRLDAFRVLTQYYTALARVAQKTGDDGDEGSTIDEFRKRIAAAADLGGPGNPGGSNPTGNGTDPSEA